MRADRETNRQVYLGLTEEQADRDTRGPRPTDRYT
jgi:hypothetical protein